MRPRRKSSFGRTFVFLLLGTACLCALVPYAWYARSVSPLAPGSEERVTVLIPKGYGVSAIADLLAEKQLIRSPLAFKVFARLNASESGLQAGSFVLQASQSVEEIIRILRTGKAAEMVLTVPEGFTAADIDALLASKGLSASGAFVDCVQTCDLSAYAFLPNGSGLLPGGKVEGYLYPNTYFVLAANFSVQVFLERLLTAFEENIVDGLKTDIADSKRSLHDIVTMASLIEREAITDEERPMIADILWKRFDEGMGLGVDASVHYAVGKPFSEPLTLADLNSNSPYNTRKFKGLPPGAIANPGLKSILAALHPKPNGYWYYLHGRDGTIRYAVTNEEHNVNRSLYLQ